MAIKLMDPCRQTDIFPSGSYCCMLQLKIRTHSNSEINDSIENAYSSKINDSTENFAKHQCIFQKSIAAYINHHVHCP